MSPMTLEQDPLATSLSLSDGRFTVELADGRSLSIPLAWYPRLTQATGAELSHWRLLGGGYAIEWPDLDEHIGIAGLQAGHRSGESPVDVGWDKIALERRPTMYGACSLNGGPAPKAACPTLRDYGALRTSHTP